MMDSDFTVGFKQGQKHGKEIIVDKVKDAIAEMKREADMVSDKEHKHERTVRENGIKIATGLLMGIEILKKHLGEELVEHE